VAERDPAIADAIESQAALLHALPAEAPSPQIVEPHTRRVPVDAGSFRRQVRASFRGLDRMSGSAAYFAAGGIVGELRQVLEQAWAFIKAGDGQSALAILDAITEEYIDGWEQLDDSDGEASSFFAGDLGPAWTEALSKAKFVLAISMFEDASTKHADVAFPAESYAEKEGTVTHPDGRLQRVRPGVPSPGAARPTWEVLVELAALLGEETGIDSAPEALAAIASEVPFYAGITEEEIGGRGVRWQERAPEGSRLTRDADVPTRGVGTSAQASQDEPPDALGNGGLLIGTYRDLWAAEVTDRSPALRFLAPTQTIELAPHDADRLGIRGGDEVDVRSNGTSLRARVAIRERVRPGSGFLIEGLGDAAGTLVGELVEITPPGEGE